MKTFISFLILCLIATCNAELRTWTAVNGKEVEADFVSNEEGVVKLKLKSGKVFEVPLNKLSKSDQEFLKAKPSSGSLVDNIVGKVITLEIEGDVNRIQFYGDGRMLTGETENVEDFRFKTCSPEFPCDSYGQTLICGVNEEERQKKYQNYRKKSGF